MKAKIAFMYGPHDLRIEEVLLPPLKPNQVLIKLKACGICGSDVECFEGKSRKGAMTLHPIRRDLNGRADCGSWQRGKKCRYRE